MSKGKEPPRHSAPAPDLEHLDRLLDEALRDSFPASDAIAVDFKGPPASQGASNDNEPGR